MRWSVPWGNPRAELPSNEGQAGIAVARYLDKKLDVSAAYPNGQVLLNMSKETTLRELCKVKGVDEEVQRMNGINLTASHVNAYEFCATMLKAPKFDELLEEFEKEVD